MTTLKTTLLIKNQERDKVLVMTTNHGWRLPVVDEGPVQHVYINSLQKAASALLGVKVLIGRQIQKQKNDNLIEYIYEAFLLQDVINGVWMRVEDIISDQERIQQYLEEKVVPVLRAPWFNGEYYHLVVTWINEELERAGLQITGEMEQIKATDFSFILVVPTNEGNVYFKTTGCASKYEASLSQYMDKKYPGKTTSIIGSDETTGWFLMKDLGGSPLREIKDQVIWTHAIREYAELQIAEIEHVPQLLEIGVPNRSVSLLKSQIEQYLEGMCDTGLSAEDKAKVMSLQRELMEMCDELQALMPVLSIDHGDLHSANIQFVNGQNVFLDWGDCVVSHPFFSTRVFWNSLYELTEKDTDEEWQEMIEQFKPVYLKAWSKFAPINTLEKAMAISNQLGCLHRGLSYYVYYTPTVEDQSDYNKPALWLLAMLEEREFAKTRE